MPAKSRAQFKFMKMMEHNPEIAKKKGIIPEQAKEFTKENVGEHRFSKLKERLKRKGK